MHAHIRIYIETKNCNIVEKQTEKKKKCLLEKTQEENDKRQINK